MSWLHADLLDELGEKPDRVPNIGDESSRVPDEFDAVFSNPPYVAERDRAALAPEILRHEPTGALFAGADGLDKIRLLIEQAAAHTRVRMLAVEVGAGQAGIVGELMRAGGFTSVGAERDLAGIERVIVGERS